MSEIEGVPEGWEVVRWGTVQPKEWVCSHSGGVHQYSLETESLGKALVVRKIEKPKRYRPFANAAEFKPHRDRWVIHPNGDESRILTVCDEGFTTWHGYTGYGEASDRLKFADTMEPLGVEVSE